MGVLTGGIWVKYLTIKICILDPTPEASGLNIQMSIISGMGRCKRKGKIDGRCRNMMMLADTDARNMLILFLLHDRQL